MIIFNDFHVFMIGEKRFDVKTFENISFDPVQCRQELARFNALLSSKTNLFEKKDLLPLFRECTHLRALLGTFNPSISDIDKIAYEYDLFGDFVCDFVVGDSENNAYCFIEFEDATKRSVFSKCQRPTSEWGRRFEKGFSQIVDWAYKLDDMKQTKEFENRFGSRTISSHSVLVAGRDSYITSSDQHRLHWRKTFVTVNSQTVSCITYDKLLNDMYKYMKRYPDTHGLGT